MVMVVILAFVNVITIVFAIATYTLPSRRQGDYHDYFTTCFYLQASNIEYRNMTGYQPYSSGAPC